MVFVDDAPLSGVTVNLNERNLGTTDKRGSVSAELQEGSHVVTLEDDDVQLPIEFRSDAEEDVEIKVTFTATPGSAPDISIRKFSVDAPAGAVLFADAAGANTPAAVFLMFSKKLTLISCPMFPTSTSCFAWPRKRAHRGRAPR